MDGFWFDKLEAGSLAWGQIRTIKEVGLATLLCNNLHNSLQVGSIIPAVVRIRDQQQSALDPDQQQSALDPGSGSGGLYQNVLKIVKVLIKLSQMWFFKNLITCDLM